MPYAHELSVAMQAADLARAILLNYFGNLSQVQEKFQAGLVSEADHASEKTIINCIKKNFPTHQILGEESGLSARNPDPAGKQEIWFIDPLDGTTNYIYQFPLFCISIALQVEGRPVVAVVDVPLLQQRFYATQGGGAFLNDKKIEVSKRQSLNEALIGVGFSLPNPDGLQPLLQIVDQFSRSTRGVRRAGAAAYDLCLVAQGVFDAFFERRLAPWDTAAGTLLVREAGGVVTNHVGAEYEASMPDIIAASPQLYAPVSEVLRKNGW